MNQLPTDIPIFLSSTFTDLKDLRQEIARRLHEVFGAPLIVMETFGSDEAPPVISSVRRVRECDVFIGIYARRYGTVDPATGKSIIELELDEAERALSAGNVIGILLYLLDDSATWSSLHAETDPAALGKLEHLKERARQHTITKVRNPEDLPFLIIRGVLSKIRERLSAVSPRPRHFALPGTRKLIQPIGMEFLTSADRQQFYGRDEKVRELLERIGSNAITLLLGNSGSGKTSLIHAGLFPRAVENGWQPVYARPLGLPRTDVFTALFAAVFEGASSYRGSLIPLLEQAVTAIHPRRLILIIDQFEDILSSREQEETQRLVADLHTVRYLDDSNIRILVSYRADLEARLGQYWQLMSGSPQGLARVYIAGIGVTEAWMTIENACHEFRIKLDLTDVEAIQIRKDLLASSARHGEEGVYPPYIQMLIDHLWWGTRDGATSYRMQNYLAAGGMEGVTGNYLTRQLAYAQDGEGHIRAVVVSLVQSYGVKAQKSLSEIASDTGLNEHDCEVSLERLIDLRLVRHIGDMFEVAHDFLAREISTKLVDSEEREFKRFRELLVTKAAAFSTTRSLLTVVELLVLFNHKERVLPSDMELRLILASWANEKAPGLFWILRATPSRVAELARAEEVEQDLDDEGRAMLVLLRRKLSDAPLRERDWRVFRRYRLGLEMAAILSTRTAECPDAVISFALRSRHRNVRTAAIEAVAQRVANRHWKWISDFGKSSSNIKREAFKLLSLRDDIPLLPKHLSPTAPRQLQEFALLQKVSRAKTIPDMRGCLRALKKFRPKARSWLFARGIAIHRSAKLYVVLNKLSTLAGKKISVLLSSVRGRITRKEFLALLRAYMDWNLREAAHVEERSRFRRAIYEDKATALARAILRTATARDLNSLRRVFERITLTPSAQYYVLAFLGVGSTGDVLRIIRKVEIAPGEIQYWFQIQVARAIEKRMTQLGGKMPGTLQRIYRRKAFWEDPRGGRSKFFRRDMLSVRVPFNRGLYLRLVAHAAIGAAQMENADLLKKLAQHKFHLVARAAAIRLTKLAGDAGIKLLQTATTEAIDQGNTESFAFALRDAEIQSLGLAELW